MDPAGCSAVYLFGIEDDDVGVRPLDEPASVSQTEESGGHIGHELDRPLQCHQPATSKGVGQETGGIGRPQEAVEMGSSVGASE